MIFNIQPYKIDYDFYPDKKVIYCDYNSIYPIEVENRLNKEIIYVDASDCIEDKPLHEFASLTYYLNHLDKDVIGIDTTLRNVYGLPVGVDITYYSSFESKESDTDTYINYRKFTADEVSYTVLFDEKYKIYGVTSSDVNHLSKVNLIVGYDYFITKEFNVETEETV